MLWLLKPIMPWKPWYDCVFGMVVRAASEEEVRRVAADCSGDEDMERPSYEFRPTRRRRRACD